jgi:ATP-dependent Clp protease ATP-binding subunit ClpB
VLFKPLTQPEIEQIVDLMAGALRTRLANLNMTFDLEEDARAFIARQGFDPVYGARPLRRYIAREVETPVARALVAGDVRDGAVIKARLTDGKLAISYDNPA